eukprot:495467-Prymnesium_polylepis.1
MGGAGGVGGAGGGAVDGDTGGGGAAEKRLALMQRFAERSSLDAPSKIGAPKVYRKERAEAAQNDLSYDDDGPAAGGGD